MTLTVNGINIEITQKKIKNMHLYVSGVDGSVRLSAPHRISDKQIEDFILSKIDWIHKHRERALSSAPADIEYIDGDTIVLFGEKYLLKTEITEKRPRAIIEEREVILFVPEDSTKEIRKALISKLYKAEIESTLRVYVMKWENITSLKCSSWSVRDMKTRWGSCSVQSKKIRFNLQLVTKPIPCIEYVVLHELAHLKVSNHGPEFKAILSEFMPDWKSRKALLNKKLPN